MKEVLQQVRDDLSAHSDPATRASGERFFREPVRMYGLKSAQVTEISKKYFRLLENRNKKDVFSVCEELWKSGYMEESFIACNWSYSVKREYEKSDFSIFERWIREYVNNWASCDTLCNHTVGTIVEKYPELLQELIKWTASQNRWVRRASAVSLIVPARKGLFLNEILDIAALLLTDNDDMVQKGYGWMLKVCSQAHLDEVYRFITERKSVMPRTALRYAIEKMPGELKRNAMAK